MNDEQYWISPEHIEEVFFNELPHLWYILFKEVTEVSY